MLKTSSLAGVPALSPALFSPLDFPSTSFLPFYPETPKVSSPPLPSPTSPNLNGDVDMIMEVEESKVPVNKDGQVPEGTPGGDCRRLCGRHQRMADKGLRGQLQKSIDNLPSEAQQRITNIWSLFSSSPRHHRTIILSGILTICCPSQLSFLSTQLPLETRIGDPFDLLPRELSLKVLGYLDHLSLCRAAQVNRMWRALADDDVLWRFICEQHIEKRCVKCGWGLPLLEKRRRERERMRKTLTEKVRSSLLPPLHAGIVGSNLANLSISPPIAASAIDVARPLKRPRIDDGYSDLSSPSNVTPNSSRPSSPVSSFSRPHPVPTSSLSSSDSLTRPWKSVYSERLGIERNWRSGHCSVQVLNGHTNAITCLQVEEGLTHPNFPILMSGGWDRTVRIWNLETGECLKVLKGHTRGIRALQFDGVKLITASMDSTLKIWNWRTGECIRTLEGHREGVISCCFDDEILASGSADSTIRIWNFATGDCFVLRGHTEWVNSVRIWNSNSNAKGCGGVGANGAGAEKEKADDALAGKLLFSASDDGTIRVWDLKTKECIRKLEGHVAQVQDIKVFSYNPDEEEERTKVIPERKKDEMETEGEDEGEDDLFNVPDGSACSRPLIFLPPSQPATTPASRCTANNNPSSARPRRTPSPRRHSPLPISPFGPKPKVVSAGLDNTIKIWNVEEGRCEKTLFGHIEGVWSVDVDRLRLVSGSQDRTVKIWDMDMRKPVHTLVGHTAAVTCSHLADDKIVTGSDDQKIRIWSFSPRSITNIMTATTSTSSAISTASSSSTTTSTGDAS
ncbi:WD40 repeat-like protein [Atractiella rhizophila]|nr:WD40 repeat-like protein [Atractiella rhizophila]